MADALNFPQFLNFPPRYQRKGTSGSARPPRSADAVHIIFNVFRYVKIKYRFHIINIDSPCRNVGRYQNRGTASFKEIHDRIALVLGKVSVKSFYLIPSRFQMFRQLIHHPLCITKNQSAGRVIVIHETAQHFFLILMPHHIVSLLDERYRHFLRRHFQKDSVFLVHLRNIQNRFRHRRGKKSRLPLFGHFFQNRFDILAESHIQHFVRFIQNKRMHMLHLNRTAAHMVHHAAGRTDDNLHPAFQIFNLSYNILSAVNRQHLDSMQISGKLAQFIRRLHGKLPRRTQHYRL